MISDENKLFFERVAMLLDPVRSDIEKFYSGKTVFITGASGYIGKLIVEKIFSSCDIKKMYILLRSKKDKMATTRFTEIFNNPIFTTLKAKKPDFLKKVSTIIGECNLPYLGIMDEDQEIIKNEVNIIFHAAAAVRFDENLKTAANINVRAVRDLLRIAKEMKHLESLIHVSTVYSNCTRNDIDEVFYNPHITCDQLLSITDSLDQKMVQDIYSSLLGRWPNVYLFTKALGENVIETYGRDLPIGIIRPSLVTATNADPFPGYIDNLYGASGIMLAAATGLLRVLHCQRTKTIDIIPADIVVNASISASLDVHKKHLAKKTTETNDNQVNDTLIFNCISSTQNPMIWDTYMEYTENLARQMPSIMYLWHCIFFFTSSKFIYTIADFILHKIPAHVIDFGATSIGMKPMLVKLYKKIDKFYPVISYFSTRKWDLHNRNTQLMSANMSIKDKKTFNFNMGALSWDEYFVKYMAGCRLNLLKDKPETISEAKKKIILLRLAHYIVATLILLVIYRLICAVVAFIVL